MHWNYWKEALLTGDSRSLSLVNLRQSLWLRLPLLSCTYQPFLLISSLLLRTVSRLWRTLSLGWESSPSRWSSLTRADTLKVSSHTLLNRWRASSTPWRSCQSTKLLCIMRKTVLKESFSQRRGDLNWVRLRMTKSAALRVVKVVLPEILHPEVTASTWSTVPDLRLPQLTMALTWNGPQSSQVIMVTRREPEPTQRLIKTFYRLSRAWSLRD